MQHRETASKARIAYNYIRDNPEWDKEYGPTIGIYGLAFTFVAETGARRTEVDSA